MAYECLIPNICFLPDAAEWHSTCRSLIVRNIQLHQPLERVAQNLGLDRQTAEDLVRMATPLIEAPTNDSRRAYIDALLCDEKLCPRANAIGRAMYELLCQGLLGRYFVRDVVLQYAVRLKQLGVDRGSDIYDDVELARLVARFVDALGVEDLAIRFSMSGRGEVGSTDLRKIQEMVDIPQTLPWVIHRMPPTKRSPAGTLIGIEVVHCFPDGRAEVVDRAFQSAILLAEVVEPWRFSTASREHFAELADSVVRTTGHRIIDRDSDSPDLAGDQQPANPSAENVAT